MSDLFGQFPFIFSIWVSYIVKEIIAPQTFGSEVASAFRQSQWKRRKESVFMSIYEDCMKKVPEYYDWMYLDGYTPYEIWFAAHKKLFSDLEKQKKPETTNIIFTTEIKTK